MSNHAHLLIKEALSGEIVQAMRMLLSTYAYWFNRKYQRSGALISKRYKSECVESDEYIFALVFYIHQNPVVAGMAKQMSSYRFSSYRFYVEEVGPLVDTGLILEMFSDDKAEAIDKLISFHQITEDKDYSLSKKVDKSARQKKLIIEALGSLQPHAVCALPKHERDAVLASLRNQGFSIRQIERATGVSRGIVTRCIK